MKLKKPPVGILILTALVILGTAATAIRFIDGLGAVTNLSDGRAWGLWVSFKYCAIAMASSGFVLAAVVYIFNIKRYYPIARPAILTAFIGYTVFILALIVDLGQPWYIWHPIINWNIHSPLFEVAVCVMTYTAVLILEFSPAVFERFKWHLPLRVIRAIQIPLVILGVVLSTLHQSSLGSMLLLMPEMLHPLWYSPILPILFLNSAIGVGLAMIIFVTTLNTKAFGYRLNMNILKGLGKAIPYVLGLYLILKLADLGVSGEIGLIFTAYPDNLLWWGEMVIGVIIPIILFSVSSVRGNRKAVFTGAVLVILGLILNRFNVTMFGLNIRFGYSYFPSLMEFAIMSGLIADSLIVVWLAHHFLPMTHREEMAAEDI
jgi:Ni/Fe-hydrogenase subunit HybB-like protein